MKQVLISFDLGGWLEACWPDCGLFDCPAEGAFQEEAFRELNLR
jgi:hypothetical protein